MTPEQEENWRRALLRFRESKDEFYRTNPDSPLEHEQREGFTGLKYFDPAPELRFETTLHRASMGKSVIMTTSKGTRQLFNDIGTFEVSVAGQPVVLHAYQSAEREDPNIFVPFKDGTSGKESYGAARYIDLEVEHDDRYPLDFNYAYNPYCAYNDGYVCPFPPPENWLKVPIAAGEMKYKD